MPSYELTLITKVASTEAQLASVKSKIESIVKDHDGKMVNFEDWGRRRLMHEISKENKGLYSYFTFTGNKLVVAELERNLRIDESVMRYLSVKVADNEDEELLKQTSPMLSKSDRKIFIPQRDSRDY